MWFAVVDNTDAFFKTGATGDCCDVIVDFAELKGGLCVKIAGKPEAVVFITVVFVF